MRLGIDGRVLVHRPTGVARYLSGLLAVFPQLQSSGDAIELFVDRAPENRIPGPPDRVTVVSWLGPGGDPVWRQVRLAAHLARRRDIDVLFCPFYTVPLAARTPSVVTIHDVSFAAHPEWFSPKARLAFRLARPSARRAQRVLVPSHFAAEEATRWIGAPAANIEVIPLGVDDSWSTPVTAEERQAARKWLGFDEPYVLHLGAVLARRRVDVLLDAAARLASRFPELRVVVAGPSIGPAPDVVRAARELGIANRVVRREWAPEPLLRPLLAEAAALVYLSEYEGFGLPALEALAVGAPVVALRRASLPEVLGDAALWIETASPNEVAGRIGECLAAQPSAIEAWRAAGKARARSFAPRRTAELTFAALREVAGR